MKARVATVVKLAILDKDGTLTRPVSGARFVQSPEDQELLPGAKEAIASLRASGCALAIASNQGGVAAGHKTLEEAISEMRFAMELTGISHGYLCPDFEGKQCYSVSATSYYAIHENGYGASLVGTFRKPGGGMLTALRELAGVRPEGCIMIGDRPEDEGAAEAAGMPFLGADVWRQGQSHE